MTGEIAFAFMAGAIATANPCGFALLPAYFARRLGIGNDDRTRDTAGALLRAFAVGAITTVGFLLVFVTIGGIISWGMRGFADYLPWIGFSIGIVLAVIGLVALAGGTVRLHLPLPRPRKPARGPGGDLAFGVGYGTVSITCTLPIFLAVTGTAITGGPVAGISSFVAYALGMGTILTALALGAALARNGLAKTFGRLRLHVDRVSGGLLFLAGLYVVYFWSAKLFPASLPGAARVAALGEHVSGALRRWLEGSIGETLLFAFLILLATLLALLFLGRILPRKRTRLNPASRIPPRSP